MSFWAGVATGAAAVVVLEALLYAVTFARAGKGGVFWALALAGTLGCSRGCAHVSPPPGPYPAVTCDLACTSFAAACPQASSSCLQLCSSVTDPSFAGCISKATSCDEGSACDRGAGQ